MKYLALFFTGILLTAYGMSIAKSDTELVSVNGSKGVLFRGQSEIPVGYEEVAGASTNDGVVLFFSQ